jgi:hypothetical protein
MRKIKRYKIEPHKAAKTVRNSRTSAAKRDANAIAKKSCAANRQAEVEAAARRAKNILLEQKLKRAAARAKKSRWKRTKEPLLIILPWPACPLLLAQ